LSFLSRRRVFGGQSDKLWGLVVFVLMVALAGCSGAGQPADRQAAGQTASEQAATETGDGTRVVTDATGEEVEVPADPRRVVALTEQDVDAALALGVEPVGVTGGRGQTEPPRYLRDRLSGVPSVGTLYRPSLEKVAELDPDLILIGGVTTPTGEDLVPQLPQLREIAPTVVTYELGDDWKTALQGAAEALNKGDEADEFLADYDERVREVKSELGPNANAEVSIVRWDPQGPIVMSPDVFAGLVVQDLGLKPLPAPRQQPGHPHSPPLSLEELGRIDAGWIFIGTLAPEGSDALDEARSNPLFRRLGAVENDHLVEVDGSLWTSVGGPLAALAVLEDVEQAMTGG